MIHAGDRVAAFRATTPGTVEFLGEGIYQGEHVRPGWQEHARTLLPFARAAFAREAARSVDDWRDWHRQINDAARALGIAKARTDAELQALAEQAFARAQEPLGWTDDQVIEDLKPSAAVTIPRLRLDNGSVVWGSDCRWGRPDDVQAHLDVYRAAGLTVTTVTPDIATNDL